jgi:cyanophycinase
MIQQTLWLRCTLWGVTMTSILAPAVLTPVVHAQQVALVSAVDARTTKPAELAVPEDIASGRDRDPLGLGREGCLLLCGGGVLPDSILDTFYDCGKASHGTLVVIPTASAFADMGDYNRWLQFWANHAWGQVEVVHAKDRQQAASDSFLDMLKRATAVWIAGGDQGRLAERYLDTPVEKELQNVLKRGGVIGGTSAGSAIASKVMIAGGYTQPRLQNGIDLLPNTIIDQHFSQRVRYKRLAQAVAAHPSRVGVGIDESTALLVSCKRAQVVGNGAVYVFRDPQIQSQPDSTEVEVVCEPKRYFAGQAISDTSLLLMSE